MDFKNKVATEFAPDDHVRGARDRLRNLNEVGSVTKYLPELRNVILTIPGRQDGEIWDKICIRLKRVVRFEVMKINV